MPTDVPHKIRAFVSLGFDFSEGRVSGNQVFGDCPFCGGHNKFYINTETTQWDCKAGSCLSRGNIYSFIHKWYHETRHTQSDVILNALATERNLPLEAIKSAGIVHHGTQWYLPVHNKDGAIVNLRRYTPGRGLRGLPGLEVSIFGAELLEDQNRRGETIYICEGEWDAIALRHLLDIEGRDGVVVGIPGAGVWRNPWNHWFSGQDCVICYDNDEAGASGAVRVARNLLVRDAQVRYIQWPSSLPEGYDVRDFVSTGAPYDDLVEMIVPWDGPVPQTTPADSSRGAAEDNKTKTVAGVSRDEFDRLISKEDFANRPSFDDVVSVFGDHLFMTRDMVLALRVIFATVLSQRIEGDPLWVHIVSPPGTAKTELLLPLQASDQCHFASTLTAHSLVSGFQTADGGDPSLLPKLDGKTFVLKDFTEVLKMNGIAKDEVYATLRGAYDGSVNKSYGNGLIREYEVKFNMITGVTHSIFGERGASLGERFLIFHLVKGVGFEAEDAIRAAIGNVGTEGQLRVDLAIAVKRFLDAPLGRLGVPQLPLWMVDKIVPLASFVAMLRASVEKAFIPGEGRRLLYRPQHEMGTRLAKQLTKLAYGLALVSGEELTEEDYELVVRVALDTCVGLNLEAVRFVIEHDEVGPVFLDTIAQALDLNHGPLRDQLDDLIMLGVLWREKEPNPTGRGASVYRYHPTPVVRGYWIRAELSKMMSKDGIRDSQSIGRTIRRPRIRVKPETMP